MRTPEPSSAPTPTFEGEDAVRHMEFIFGKELSQPIPGLADDGSWFLVERDDPSIRYASDLEDELEEQAIDDPFQNDRYDFVYIGETGFHLQSDWLLVELTEPERVLPSGIILPETALENHEEGIVLGSGPGVLCENGILAPTRMSRGEQVYFPKHAFYAMDIRNALSGRRQTLGFVRERDLVAYTHPVNPDELIPLNDYLMLRQCPAEETLVVGVVTLHVPERARKAPHCGTLIACGFGSLQTTGELAGAKRPVVWDLGVKDSDHTLELGDKVYWEADTKRVVIADLDGEAFSFVRARDCIAFSPASGE